MDAKSLLNISPLQSQSLVGFFFPSFICYPSVRQQTDSSSDPTLFHSSFTTYSLYSPPPFSHSLPSSPPPVLLCVVCRVKWRPGANKLSPPATLIRHTHTHIHIQSHHTSANSHNHKCTSALHTHTHTHVFFIMSQLWRNATQLEPGAGPEDRGDTCIDGAVLSTFRQPLLWFGAL